ncbi:hypothetical protein [Intrasporangium sp. YIM S08009]|uniref:hypothetical protein n=1 Tax=Intrasporangium zincisolvens TaxID=3080018 RepID=UPI002B05A53C|nr:hypothetical protein [Intrasporangium sp. YIM S08009]
MRAIRGYGDYLLALAILWVAPAVLVTVLHHTLPTENPNGQCSGIGFGCTLTPADGVLFLGMLAAPVLFLLGLAAIALIARSRRRRQRLRSEDVRPAAPPMRTGD